MIKKSFIFLIRTYKLILSPIFGPSCRYLPTCSDYFIENIKENGILKGSINGCKRILSCHPIKILGGGEGFDPVKKKK